MRADIGTNGTAQAARHRIILYPTGFSHDLPKVTTVSDTDRLTELEIQLSHQQRMTEQLNEVVTLQTKTIDGLGRRIQMLENQVRQLRENPQGAEDLLDEKPPHY